jgi:hypothetical protein
MYNKKRTPTEFTGCGNHQCPIKTGCQRYETARSFTNMFNPSRLADGRISCAMRIESRRGSGVEVVSQ